MRGRARAALVLMAVSASFGLAGCAAIDELKEAFSRWVESEKLPGGRDSSGADLPDATPVTAPEKPAKKEASRPPKKQVKSARKPQRPRPQTVVLPPEKPPIPDAAEAAHRDEIVVAGNGEHLPVAHQRRALVGVGVVADHVAEAGDAPHAARIEGGEHRAERLAVAVDVA